MKDKISEKLNVVSMSEIKKKKDDEVTYKNYKNDFDVAKETLKDTLNVSSEAIEEIFEIAKSSQSGRAFEVLATLLKTTVDASVSLGELALKEQKFKENENKDETSKNENPKYNLSEIISALKENKENEN